MNKLYSSKIFTAFLLLVLLSAGNFIGCKKNSNVTDPGTNPPDLITTINGSASGFVTDENGQPAANAAVQFGSLNLTTDKYGYFEANNTAVIKEAATVTVTKAGYFKAIKTYTAAEGKPAFFRIKLIPKTVAGTINAGSGGTVTLTNGLSVGLPAAAVVTASNAAAYTGTINIALQWINPTSTDLPNIMPGDLRGINTDGNMQLLTTYGMAAVELTGSGGQLLQIATGKKATLTMPLPASLQSSAPASIPLWYFDETKGLWIQQGSATKSGSNYVGEVSHFSFWNCDISNTYVPFSCTIVSNTGAPLPGVLVKISEVSNPANSGFGYTNSAGYVNGVIPDNRQLLLEVFSFAGCGSANYSQNITTTTAPVTLGNITMPFSVLIANVTGSVTNCSNQPVSNGYINIQSGNSYLRSPLNSSGVYTATILLCSSSTTATFIADDITGNQQSIPAVYTINAGSTTIPTIQACGVSTLQFFNYTVNGLPSFSFSTPVDSFHQGPPVTIINPSGSTVNSYFTGQTPNTNNYSSLFITLANMAPGSTQSLSLIFYPQLEATLTIPNPIDVHITEFGAVGQFISGYFSGIVKGGAPNNTLYTLGCSFRIRRNM
ncbi:carboxypeptidase-like regulatory domain-containing protein [Ferruginibacter sp.]